MRRSAWIIGLCLGSCSLAFGQDVPAHPKKMAPTGAMVYSAKVTRSEARAVFAKMEQILTTGNGVSGSAPKIDIPSGGGFVTRHEVIAEFSRLFDFYQPHFKFTPPKVSYDPGMLTVSSSDKAATVKLIRWGAIAKQGPIASGSVPTLTVHQFGDAIGFFVNRIESLSSIPPSKWTPYLNGGRD